MPAWEISRGAAADVIAKRTASAISHVTRAAKNANGEQTLLLAADEVVKAAPPKSNCFSPAGPGVGQPCVDPDSVEISRALCQIR